MEKVNLAQKTALVTEHWTPKVIASLNGQEVKLARLHGEFVWHSHENADELFLVLEGHLHIEFREHTVALEPGELLVIPRGVEHRPVAPEEVVVLLFEPEGVINTGDAQESDLTAPTGVHI